MTLYGDIRRTIEVTTGPATEPITTAEAKAALNVTSSDDDTYIDTLIATARTVFEAQTGRSLITRTLTLHLDRWPDFGIKIPYGPISAVTTVKYYDAAASQITWDAGQYWTDLKPIWAWVVPRDGVTFPDLQAGRIAPIEIEYVAGYASASAIPDDFKTAIKALVAHWYRTREPVQGATGARFKVPVHLGLLMRSVGLWEF